MTFGRLHLLRGAESLVSPRGLFAAVPLLLPALPGFPPWLAVTIAGVGPLTELLGPRLASGLGRARGARTPQACGPHPVLPAPLVALAQARELLSALSRRCSERLLALTQRLNPLEAQARPRPEELAACEALTRECLLAWHDLRRGATRFREAQQALTEFIADHQNTITPAGLAELDDAVAELQRFFDRVAQNQQPRAHRLLLNAGLLARHAAHRGLALTPTLREELRELAERVAHDHAPLPYASLAAYTFGR